MEGLKRETESKESFENVFDKAYELLATIDSSLKGFERDNAISSLMNELMSSVNDDSSGSEKRQVGELVESIAQVAKYQEKVIDINDYIKSHPGVANDKNYLSEEMLAA